MVITHIYHGFKGIVVHPNISPGTEFLVRIRKSILKNDHNFKENLIKTSLKNPLSNQGLTGSLSDDQYWQTDFF